MEITLEDGTVLSGEKAAAKAHPNSGQGWVWPDYLRKFDTLTEGLIDATERDRFVGMAERVGDLSEGDVKSLNPVLPKGAVAASSPDTTGIFDY